MEGESDDRMENGKKRRRNGEEREWGGWREIKKEEINKRKIKISWKKKPQN